jgi:alpha-glucosidase (family GH31 glycosyl hydrolase)
MDTKLMNRNQSNKMPNKVSKPFYFTYPHTKIVVDLSRGRGYSTVHICDLDIQGKVYHHTHSSVLDAPEDRFEADIDYIMYEGNNIKEVLEPTDLFDKIYSACIAHASLLFDDQNEAA